MMPISLQELVPVLQIAIIPVILISGVSLFLLTLTNRFGRVTDRVRHLAMEARGPTPVDKARIAPQITALFRRAYYLRAAVTFASISVLLNVSLVIVLFVAAFFNLELGLLICVVFMGSMLTVAASTITFLLDLHLSLRALAREIEHTQGS